MIERHTFVDMLETIKEYSSKIRQLETTLDCVFENWMTQHESDMIYHLSRAFFDTDDIRNIDRRCSKDDIIEQQQENVEDILLFYCYESEFGKQKEKLVDVYERGVVKMSATSPDKLYDIIIDYLENVEEDVTFLPDLRSPGV